MLFELLLMLFFILQEHGNWSSNTSTGFSELTNKKKINFGQKEYLTQNQIIIHIP